MTISRTEQNWPDTETVTIDSPVTLQQMDAECNELQNKLDRLRSMGRDRNDDAEYMQALYTLRDKTRARLGIHPDNVWDAEAISLCT